MKDRKTDSFVYEGFGFPILLENVPMRKRLGEWTFDFDLEALEKAVLLSLIEKQAPLSGSQIRFIRHFLNMSTYEFADILGVTHAAVLHWEKIEKKMNVGNQIVLRLYVLNHLKVTDKEFRKIYQMLNPKSISKAHFEDSPLEIDVEKIA